MRENTTAPVAAPRSIRSLWLGLGLIGWTGTIWLGVSLYSTDPRSAGFDLELLLEAGRRVAAGLSPYDPGLVAGTAPAAPSLFYSYPPPVAFATSVVAGVPSAVVLVGWCLIAVLLLLTVAELLRRRLAPERAAVDVLLPVAAVAPFVFPFTIGLLFGNADAFFPFLYGLMLIGALTADRWGAAGAGIALALASLKLHPASLGAWFVGRGFRERSAGRDAWAWRALVVAVAAVAVIVVASLVVGGAGPWTDYLAVVRAGSGADIVDPRNAAPAATIAALVGGDAALARILQVPVSLVAVLVTLVVAARDHDVVESFAVATVASLVTLPVTWYHYPAALFPVAIAALLRASPTRLRSTASLVAGAVVLGTVAVMWVPLVWVAVALVLLAVRASASPEPDLAKAAGVASVAA